MLETKIPKLSSEMLAGAAQRIGLVIMSAALTMSVLELPDEAKRVVLPAQPAPVWVGESGGGNSGNNELRRERDETAPHFISYGVSQRTPSRSGRG